MSDQKIGAGQLADLERETAEARKVLAKYPSARVVESFGKRIWAVPFGDMKNRKLNVTFRPEVGDRGNHAVEVFDEVSSTRVVELTDAGYHYWHCHKFIELIVDGMSETGRILAPVVVGYAQAYEAGRSERDDNVRITERIEAQKTLRAIATQIEDEKRYLIGQSRVSKEHCTLVGFDAALKIVARYFTGERKAEEAQVTDEAAVAWLSDVIAYGGTLSGPRACAKRILSLLGRSWRTAVYDSKASECEIAAIEEVLRKMAPGSTLYVEHGYIVKPGVDVGASAKAAADSAGVMSQPTATTKAEFAPIRAQLLKAAEHYMTEFYAERVPYDCNGTGTFDQTIPNPRRYDQHLMTLAIAAAQAAVGLS